MTVSPPGLGPMSRAPLIVSVRGGPAVYARVVQSTVGTRMKAAPFEENALCGTCGSLFTTLTVRTPG
jgi:hypothetical protein